MYSAFSDLDVNARLLNYSGLIRSVGSDLNNKDSESGRPNMEILLDEATGKHISSVSLSTLQADIESAESQATHFDWDSLLKLTIADATDDDVWEFGTLFPHYAKKIRNANQMEAKLKILRDMSTKFLRVRAGLYLSIECQRGGIKVVTHTHAFKKGGRGARNGETVGPHNRRNHSGRCECVLNANEQIQYLQAVIPGDQHKFLKMPREFNDSESISKFRNALQIHKWSLWKDLATMGIEWKREPTTVQRLQALAPQEPFLSFFEELAQETKENAFDGADRIYAVFTGPHNHQEKPVFCLVLVNGGKPYPPEALTLVGEKYKGVRYWCDLYLRSPFADWDKNPSAYDAFSGSTVQNVCMLVEAWNDAKKILSDDISIASIASVYWIVFYAAYEQET
jgi:hypothetical protein